MFRRISSIALLHMKLALNSRRVFFFALVVPILFTGLIAQANMTGFGSGGAANWQIEVVAADRSAVGQSLVADLRASGRWKINETPLEEALGRINTGRSAAALIIPDGFTESVFDGRPATLELRTAAGAVNQARLAEQSVREAVDKVTASALAAKTSLSLAGRLGRFESERSQVRPGQHRAYFESAYAQATRALGGAAPVIMRFESGRPINASVTGRDSGNNQSSPGAVVIFAMLFAVTGTHILIWERRVGALRRLLVTPAGRTTILLGKLLGIYVIGIAQILLLILAGKIFFGVAWGNSPGALALMVLALTLVTTSIGLLLATLVKTSDQADSLSGLVVMALSMLGGAWWPLSVMPPWMRFLGHLFPIAWAMEGFKDIIVSHHSVTIILPELVVLLGFAAVFMSVGLIRFRHQ